MSCEVPHAMEKESSSEVPKNVATENEVPDNEMVDAQAYDQDLDKTPKKCEPKPAHMVPVPEDSDTQGAQSLTDTDANRAPTLGNEGVSEQQDDDQEKDALRDLSRQGQQPDATVEDASPDGKGGDDRSKEEFEESSSAGIFGEGGGFAKRKFDISDPPPIETVDADHAPIRETRTTMREDPVDPEPDHSDGSVQETNDNLGGGIIGDPTDKDNSNPTRVSPLVQVESKYPRPVPIGFSKTHSGPSSPQMLRKAFPPSKQPGTLGKGSSTSDGKIQAAPRPCITDPENKVLMNQRVGGVFVISNLDVIELNLKTIE